MGSCGLEWALRQLDSKRSETDFAERLSSAMVAPSSRGAGRRGSGRNGRLADPRSRGDRFEISAVIKFFSTNTGITAATLLLLLLCLSFRDVIPYRKGIGYDGIIYGRWTRVLSLDVVLDGTVTTPRGRIAKVAGLDTYYARRILPSLCMSYTLTALGVAKTIPNIVNAFTAANILLLGLAVFCWCKAADELAIGVGGKWLGFLALIVSYANLKMPLYYPVLTDTYALALGSACLLFYLKRRPVALFILSFAGAFVWPTIIYFSFLLLSFPRTRADGVEPGPRGLHTLCAAAVALAALVYTEFLLVSGYEMKWTPVKPTMGFGHLGAAIAALYLFFGLRPLLNSASLWRSFHPLGLLRRPWLWGAGLLLVTTEAMVRSIAVMPTELGPLSFVNDTFYTSVTQPGIFYLAHVLYFGPLLLFLPFLWPRVSSLVKRQGTGLISCFALALLMSVGSESRKLINFLPFVVLFLVQALEDLVTTPRRFATLAALALVFSKIWLPMDQALSIPFVGAVEWRSLYVSSRGPWIDHPTYVIQLVLVLLVIPLVYSWSLRDGRAAK